MNEKKIYYNFDAWIKGKENDSFDGDRIVLFDESLEALIEKIKLFNKVACFECWTSLTFYKWEVTLLDNNVCVDKRIVDASHFPEIIDAHKIEVWGKTYEI